MASRHQSLGLVRQLRSVVRPCSDASFSVRNFASSSVASAERQGDNSTTSSPGTKNPSPSADSTEDRQPPRRASAADVEDPDSAKAVLENVQSPQKASPTPESATAIATAGTSGSSASSSAPTSSSTRGRRTRGKKTSDIPPIVFDDKALASFPPLLHRSHPVYDDAERIVVPPRPGFKYGASFTAYNTERKPHFPGGFSDSNVLQGTDEHSDAEPESVLNRVPMTKAEMAGLHVHTIDVRFPQQQTGKGKIQSMSTLTVVGNGKGLVGFANEKHEEPDQSRRRSVQQAIKNMEYIKRFESRTIHRTMVGTFSATTVYLRPRPPGFGLRCPPSVHAVARSAGISDLSASIIGSAHPINVCRAVMAALSSGSGPAGFGDGIGGPGRRVDRGQGAKTLEDLEVERGRRFRILQG
ncbi:unnamed protein product [Sympodiomycopsis kandeliae]